MSEAKCFEISSQDADRLIAAHDAEVALLYIYRLRTGCTDDERTARDLCMTLRAVKETSEKLERMTQPTGAAQKYAKSLLQAWKSGLFRMQRSVFCSPAGLTCPLCAQSPPRKAISR